MSERLRELEDHLRDEHGLVITETAYPAEPSKTHALLHADDEKE